MSERATGWSAANDAVRGDDDAPFAPDRTPFREANDRVGRAALRLGIDRPIAFMCECGRRDCTAIVRLLPRDYERIRSVTTYVLCAPGHDDGLANGVVVERRDGAVVVERTGRP